MNLTKKELITLEEVVFQSCHCDNRKTFHQIIQTLKELIPFSGYSACILCFRRTKEGQKLISLTGDDLATGNKLWEERYFRKKYYLVDPIILEYLKQTRGRKIFLQFWHDTYSQYKKSVQIKFVEDAKKHGLNHGFTHGFHFSPIHGALFSFWSPEFNKKTNSLKYRWILEHCIVPLSFALNNTPNSNANELTSIQNDLAMLTCMGIPVETIAWLRETSQTNVSKIMESVHGKYSKGAGYQPLEEYPFDKTEKKRRGNIDNTHFILSRISRF